MISGSGTSQSREAIQPVENSILMAKIFDNSLEGDTITTSSPRQAREELNIIEELKTQFNVGIANFASEILEPKAEIIPYCPVDIKTEVRARFDIGTVKTSLVSKLTKTIMLNSGSISDNFDPQMKSPEILDPMYYPLKKLSLDYILPGAGDLDNNIVFLMEENRKFIESYMVGLNHEMNRELVWREYPTDQRRTIFQHFWDYATLEEQSDVNSKPQPRKDIDEITQWYQKLGINKSDVTQSSGDRDIQKSNLVLVIKGDLIQRYPDLNVYALKEDRSIDPATYDPNDLLEEKIILPIFRGELGNDILIVGFPFSKQDIVNSEREYYFVLQENQDLPVFGLDGIDPAESYDSIPENPNDLNWGHVINNLDETHHHVEDNYIHQFPNELFGSTTEINGEDQTSGTNPLSTPTSASFASRTYQVPVRILYHAKTMLNITPENIDTGP